MAPGNSSGISCLAERVEALGRRRCDWTKGIKSKPDLTCSGSITVNKVYSPSSDSTLMVPPSYYMMVLVMYSPSPVPSLLMLFSSSSLPNTANNLSILPFGIPTPLS